MTDPPRGFVAELYDGRQSCAAWPGFWRSSCRRRRWHMDDLRSSDTSPWSFVLRPSVLRINNIAVRPSVDVTRVGVEGAGRPSRAVVSGPLVSGQWVSVQWSVGVSSRAVVSSVEKSRCCLTGGSLIRRTSSTSWWLIYNCQRQHRRRDDDRRAIRVMDLASDTDTQWLTDWLTDCSHCDGQWGGAPLRLPETKSGSKTIYFPVFFHHFFEIWRSRIVLYRPRFPIKWIFFCIVCS